MVEADWHFVTIETLKHLFYLKHLEINFDKRILNFLAHQAVFLLQMFTRNLLFAG